MLGAHGLEAPGFELGGPGPLDASACATATFTLPTGSDPGLAGVTVHHAYVVLDLPSLAPRHVSRAVRLDLVP